MAGLSPWKFGMSKSDVSSFSQLGPYKKFSNGDLETFAGIFDGHRENIQFFFAEAGLRRIGVYIYEGKDIKSATAKWQQAYRSLQALYGAIETPGINAQQLNSPGSLEILADAAGAAVSAGQKIQMAPTKQPDGLFIFSSFYRLEVHGNPYFYVTIYLNPSSAG